MTNRANNLPQRSQVERLVREAIAQLAVPRGFHGAPRAADVAPAGGELVLVERLVTLEHLKGRVDGLARLIVPRGAVFSPAARDELKQRNIAVASSVERVESSTVRNLPLALVDANLNPATLVAWLAAEQIGVEMLDSRELIATVDELCRRVSAGTKRAALLSAKTAAAACLANRQRGIRAAVVASVQDVVGAVAEIGVNFLIVDPAGKGPFALRQIFRAWVRGNSAVCPTNLISQLG